MLFLDNAECGFTPPQIHHSLPVHERLYFNIIIILILIYFRITFILHVCP